METISIINAADHVNEQVKIGVWISNKRSSGKIAFLQLRDGTATFQGVALKNELGETAFAQLTDLAQETSLWVTGTIHADTRSPFGYELAISQFEVVGTSHDYPITWISNKRSSGKIAFLQLRDGTATFQGVALKNELGETAFAQLTDLAQETSLWVTGTIHADTRSPFGYELAISQFEVVGTSHDYPITPKALHVITWQSPCR
ncbi:hypothetical protein WP50_07245 [Lactiplantibacillus plantarum]|nr:hypothetical protein WP50_07245 [Lactiplantibacillus plantarum]